jgi:single-strand DNA-binding protein
MENVMQKLIIAGTVGKDAVLRRTGNGDAVLGFSVAVDQGKDASGNKRDALWVDCSIWGKRAEALQSYITKGSKLALEGRPTVRAHDGKAYLGMAVNELTFQGGGSERQGGDDYQRNDAPQSRELDDEVPF